MAGSQSFGKRENEKKKQAKRLEKQKSKEERRAAGTSSFDEMIAWVDEYGNLTTEQPSDDRKHKASEIKLEDIAVSTPKKEDVVDEPLKGRVEHFNEAKGYGFIKDLASTEKYFFHVSVAPEGIAEGKMVTFELERGDRGLSAVRIQYTQA